MQWIRSLRKISVTCGFLSLICILGWLDLSLCLWFLAAVLVHEIGHLALLKLLRVPVNAFVLGAAGAVISTPLLSYRQELICALGGPVLNFLCAAIMCRICPAFSVISVCLGSINLLPLYPLDGGRVFSVLLHRWLPGAADRITEITAWILCGGLMVLTCWITVAKQAGIWPIFGALVTLWRIGNARREER